MSMKEKNRVKLAYFVVGNENQCRNTSMLPESSYSWTNIRVSLDFDRLDAVDEKVNIK